MVGDARRHRAVGARFRFLLRGLQLLLLHHQELVLADLIPTSPIVGLDHLAGDRIDELLPQAIAGLPVDLPERNSLGGGESRIKANRAGDERKLQIALPMRTRGPYDTPENELLFAFKWLRRLGFLSRIKDLDQKNLDLRS